MIFSKFYNTDNCNKQIKHFKLHHESDGKRYAIINVVNNIPPGKYKFAMDTVNCYAHAFNYTYITVEMKNEPEIGKICNQSDIMFVRHCFLAEYLELHKEFDYVLFVDADTAVINPYHSLVEFAPKGSEEILLYSRIFNYEIACGSFFFKNSDYSRNFLKDFANFYYEVPDSMYGRDNAAIQAFFLEKFEKTRFLNERKICYEVWNKSKNWNDIWDFEACMMNLLEKASETPTSTKLMTFDNGKVVVVGKESERRWIRDGLITRHSFCKKDFLLHGYKGLQSAMPYVGINEFVFNHEECSNRRLSHLWSFKNNSFIECSDRDKLIAKRVAKVRKEFMSDLNDSGYLKKYNI